MSIKEFRPGNFDPDEAAMERINDEAAKFRRIFKGKVIDFAEAKEKIEVSRQKNLLVMDIEVCTEKFRQRLPELAERKRQEVASVDEGYPTLEEMEEADNEENFSYKEEDSKNLKEFIKSPLGQEFIKL